MNNRSSNLGPLATLIVSMAYGAAIGGLVGFIIGRLSQ